MSGFGIPATAVRDGSNSKTALIPISPETPGSDCPAILPFALAPCDPAMTQDLLRIPEALASRKTNLHPAAANPNQFSFFSLSGPAYCLSLSGSGSLGIEPTGVPAETEHHGRCKSMRISRNMLLASAALAGFVAGSTPALSAQDAPLAKKAPKPKKDVHSCAGKNSCKGRGGCKSGDNGCKGRNSCKGKGGCATGVSKKSSVAGELNPGLANVRSPGRFE